MFVPVDRAAVAQDALAGLDVARLNERFLLGHQPRLDEFTLLLRLHESGVLLPRIHESAGCVAVELRLLLLVARAGLEAGECFILRGIEERLDFGAAAHHRVGRGEVEVLDTVLDVPDGMAARMQRCVERELHDRLEDVLLVVVESEALLIQLAERLDAHVVAVEAFAAGGVGGGEEAVEPHGSGLVAHRAHALAEAFRIDEVAKVDAHGGVKPALVGQIGNRPGAVEIAQRVASPARVAPEPVNPVAVDDALHGILAEDLAVEHALRDRRRVAEFHAVAVDAFAGHAVEALGDVDAADFERRLAAGREAQGLAGVAEAVRRIGVAVALDPEVDVLIHESRIVDGGDAGAVGDEDDLIDGAKFDKRHAALRLRIDDGDA
ncbi:MAG: hypothetical protein D8M52_11215, partial [Chlorobi bacterium]|nr:hypothetical protein [Chlorobiota bacterium]